MAVDKTDIERALGREKRLLKQFSDLHEQMCLLYQANEHQDFYDKALEAQLAAEKLAVTARTIPIATGRPTAHMDVELNMEQENPVEMGYTEQGWFLMKMPLLPPKKDSGSPQYIRDFLYPAMKRFMGEDQYAVRFRECILIYRHVYTREYDPRRYRDHDNIELNLVTDTVAVKVMVDDSPMLCRHYYCSGLGDRERTELYVIPRGDFFKWLSIEAVIPEEGLEVGKTPSLLRE